MLFDLERVTLARDGKIVLQDVSFAAQGGELRRRAVRDGQVDAPAAAEPARRPRRRDGALRGRDVRERDPLELRREVCLVPQLPALLHGTVADNVRFGAGLAGREPDVAGCSSWPALTRRSRSATRQALGR